MVRLDTETELIIYATPVAAYNAEATLARIPNDGYESVPADGCR
jgi:hypothetical protein